MFFSTWIARVHLHAYHPNAADRGTVDFRSFVSQTKSFFFFACLIYFPTTFTSVCRAAAGTKTVVALCVGRIPISTAQGHIAMATVSQHVVPLVFSQLIRGRICNSNKPVTFNQLWTVEEQVRGRPHVWDHTGVGRGGELFGECDAEPQLPHLMALHPHGKGGLV